MSDSVKYNFGSGKKIKSDYINVDVLDWDGRTDIQYDLSRVPYHFAEPNSAEKIESVEFLEHIEFKKAPMVLKEWYKILEEGGEAFIQVPDAGKAMEYYVNDKICECVPHKKTRDGFEADDKCFKCAGEAKINPKRWLRTFTGSQKGEYDIHRNIFTKEKMDFLLKQAGFDKISYEDHIYKLKVTAQK